VNSGRAARVTADSTSPTLPGGKTQRAARIFKTFTAAELDATEASDDTKEPLNGRSRGTHCHHPRLRHPKALAEFYRKVIGWKVTHSDDDFAYLGGARLLRVVKLGRGVGLARRCAHSQRKSSCA